MKAIISLFLLVVGTTSSASAYTPHHQRQQSPNKTPAPAPAPAPVVLHPSKWSQWRSRREFGVGVGTAAIASMGILLAPSSTRVVHAFDGSGASASSGYNPATKAEKVRGWKQRVAADVHDFLTLGDAIEGSTTATTTSTSTTTTTTTTTTIIAEDKAWGNFFIPYQRREPDTVGRTYAALVDLRGVPTSKKYEYEGGAGILLATSLTKPGKPPENTPAVKAWNKLFKTFDAIEAAGKKGDTSKAKVAWTTTKELLQEYLTTVNLPGDLSDSIYK